MEGMQATDGSRYFNGAVKDVMRQAAGQETLAQKLQREQEAKRTTRRQGRQRPSITPFAPGRNSMDGKGAIPAASTGSQRGTHLSAAPIPKAPPRKAPNENAQAGPSRSRAEPQIIAGSRKKLNLNQTQESEDDWSIQDPVPHNVRSMSPPRADAGPSHYRQSPRFIEGKMQRTDGLPPPIYAQPGGRGRSTTTSSRSASPTKKKTYQRRLSNADVPYEEEEQIEDPEGPFPEDQEASDFELVEPPGHPPTKATKPSNVFTSGVAEGTRAGSARRLTGSASPQRATTGHVDTKGKGKAVDHDIFTAPDPVYKTRKARQSTGSTSPVKPNYAAGHPEPKGKGKSPDRGYIEIDEQSASGEHEDGHHRLPAPPTKKSVIPTSALSHNVLMCCNALVVWCVDMKGQKRRMKVRQVELHSDGIVLGDSNVRRSGLYISLSNISETESCERQACPFIVLNVKTKLSKTKLDSDRFKSLLLPGITESSRRAPTEDEMSTLRFFVHLESGANSEDFIQTHRQLTEYLTHGLKFRLTRQDCEGHRAVGPKPNHDDPEAPAAAKQSLPLAAKNHDLDRTPNQDPAVPRQRARPSVELPGRNSTAKQSARPREKDKEREIEPLKAKPSRIAKLTNSFLGMIPSRQSNRLSGAKPTASEAEDLCSEDEVVPEPPKTPALAPPADRGTVLFPFPLSGRSILNITKFDLWRVMSGEFLNDTLIEWGLQLLLSDLKGANSESDIHLFNSFFYSKISSKERDKKLQPKTESSEARWPAYETVRKWTKSVDVFSKKFIIVPINEEYHWYLAIIYNPGLMLVQPPADTLPPPTEKVETPPGADATRDANDENDVDAELGSAREESNPDAPNSIMAIPDSDEPMDGSHVADESVDELDCIERSPPVNKMKDLEIGSGFARPRIKRPPPPPGREISDPTLEAVRAQNENHASSSRAEAPVSKPESVKAVPVKAERAPDHIILDSQKPWIITFDSLGATHKAVGKNLAQWLQWEARDKKGGNYDHVQVEYTHAQVPLQTNFSDCGLYLVHYARQLLTNPETVLKFVERRLPRKDSDERKQFDAEIETIWGISRDHNLRDEWQAKINSLKEQYEGQKVGNPAEEDPKAPKEDDQVAEGDSGEGFLDEVNPGNGVMTDLPAPENVAVQVDEGIKGRGDQIEAEKSTEILDNTATAKKQPPNTSNADHDAMVAEPSPRPIDSEQDDHTASEANSAMAERPEKYHDELESGDDEASETNSPPTGTIAEPRPFIESDKKGRSGSPSLVQEEEEAEDDAISSVVSDSTTSNETGTSEHTGPAAVVDEYDAVDPALGGPEVEQNRPTTHLEDEGMELDSDQRHFDPPTDVDAGSRNPISSQASAESLRMIKAADLVHDSNPGPSGKPISRQAPGESAEEAIDIDNDDEDNTDTAPGPSHLHIAADVDPPVSATPTSARSSTLFMGLTPSGASARKTAVDNRQPGSSPLTSLATSRGEADVVPPSFRADSTSSRPSAVKASAPSSPLTPAGTDFGEVEHVLPPSISEDTSGRGKAKKAPPAARASLAPWQNGNLKGNALHALGGRQTPVSRRNKFADLESNSSAENTLAGPDTPVYASMMKGEGSGARQNDGQSGPMSSPMVRLNSGGLDTLNDPEPASVKRHMSLDKSCSSQDRSSQSGTPVLGPDSRLPSIEDDVGPADDPMSEELNASDTSNISAISPAKRPKTLDTRSIGRQSRKHPSNIAITDQEVETDNVESRGEAASLPEQSSSRQLDPGSSGSVSAPVSRLQPRSSTSDIVLTEANGRPVVLDTREEQYEAEPWAQTLFDRANDTGPTTSTSAIPYQRKTRRNQSTAMPLEKDYLLLDNDGNVDNLESHSDEDFVPKQPRRSSRPNTTSPQAPQGTRVAASTSSSDDIQHQSEMDAADFGGRSSLARTPRVVHRYGNRNKELDPKPAPLKQGQLPYGTPRSSLDKSAGSASKTRKTGASQKRQNENTPESSTSAKKKKVIDDPLAYNPAQSSRTGGGAKPRKAKRRGRNSVAGGGSRDDGQSKGDAISVDSDGE